MALLAVLVVLISEVFRVPLTAYSAYIVFFVSKEETASTLLTAIVLTIAVTVAVSITLVIYMISAGEPGLRLPLMALSAFVGLFFSRVSPLGPAAFATGFVVTVALTLIDVIPNVEALTELVLWLWVVIMLPVGMVVVGNFLGGRDPGDLFWRSLASRLDEAGRLLNGEQIDGKLLGQHIRAGLLDPLRYLKLSGRRRSPRQTAAYEALVARSHEVLVLAAEWRKLTVEVPALTAVAGTCGEVLQAIARSLGTKGPFASLEPLPSTNDGLLDIDPRAGLLLARMVEIVSAMPGLLAEQHSVAVADPRPAKPGLLVADAFTNPEHVQFALKVTLAAMSAYIAYNLLAWPGIRTAMITCFFVTVGNVGETVHKMTLRLTGAVIGGALGYATILFLMPAMDSISDLCLAIGAVAFLAGWISVGSEKLSYAGMQIAMAYFFCVLVGYGPTIDLTEARNRVVGVLLGNVIVWLVFANIWPVSAVAQARAALASAIKALSSLVLLKATPAGGVPSQQDRTVFALDNALARTWRLLSFELFEPEAVRAARGERIDGPAADAVQALLGPTLLLSDAAPPGPILDEARRSLGEEAAAYRMALASWLSKLAERVASDKAGPALEAPPEVTMAADGEELLGAGGARLLAQVEWSRELCRRSRDLAALAKDRLNISAAGAAEQGGTEA